MIDLIKVKSEEEAILHNLMQFYIYEFSQYQKVITLENDGRYKLFDLEKYWDTDSPYYAFFIKYKEEYVGFALIEKGRDELPSYVEEFFVVRKYHGKGFGRIAAQRLFSMFEGKWKVVQIQNNYPAQAFWRKTIQEFTSNSYEESYDDHRRSVQEFDTRQLT